MNAKDLSLFCLASLLLAAFLHGGLAVLEQSKPVNPPLLRLAGAAAP